MKQRNSCLQSNLQLLHDSWKDLNPKCEVHARAILESAVEPNAQPSEPQVDEEGIFGVFSSFISSIAGNNRSLTNGSPISAKTMFRRLAPSIHPDKIHDAALKPLADLVHQQVTDAYVFLTSPPK